MLSIRRLIWDTWNVAHIARHAVTPEEVEEVCHGEPVASQTYKGRIRVVGPTRRGRMLTVILAPTDEARIYYPITARPADRKERRNYREQRGQE
ncbi:MAG: BrnT family toxin, partial [Nitrospinae bacterium]|nr:BrnT family toxin [Nitrospinota bacterium]